MSSYRRHVGRPVSVTLVNGDYLEGTLARAARDAITLTGSRVLERHESTPLAGALIIPTERILTVQVEVTDGV